jgi:hypothetical protein
MGQTYRRRICRSPSGLRGVSVTIYNANLDPGGSDARRIVRFVTDVAPFLARSYSRSDLRKAFHRF